MCIKVAPKSRKEIWSYVKNIRMVLGIENKYYFNIVNFIEKILPCIMPDFVLEIVPDDELKDKYAETLPLQFLIRVRESTYNGACNGINRDRFTLAHELGHLLMHRQDISLAQYCNKNQIAAYEDAEWQANIFAAEILAPSYLVKDLDEIKISELCGISQDCASHQLDNIRKENQKQKIEIN